jgi:hypothetical protein
MISGPSRTRVWPPSRIYLDYALNPIKPNQTLFPQNIVPGKGGSPINFNTTCLSLFAANPTAGDPPVLATITRGGRTQYR